MLPCGKYRTLKGSTMQISGKHSGISVVFFDWVEEDACCDCVPELYDDYGFLIWHCSVCSGGSARLFAVSSLL